MEDFFMTPQVQADMTPYSGGKLKARKGTLSLKRNGTPYERPSGSRHGSARPQAQVVALPIEQKGGWMDSASRILTKSATFLFNSMFKRQAPAITAAPAIQDSELLDCEDVPPLEIAQPSGAVDGLYENEEFMSEDLQVSRSASLQAADLENLLKQKDLTREQCERYIDLIQSKILDSQPLQNGKANRTVSSPRVSFYFRSSGLLFWFLCHNQDLLVTGNDKAQALVPWEEPSVVAARAVSSNRSMKSREPQIATTRSERWTPIQMPISGGRELLKKRAPVLNEKVTSAKKTSPSHSSCTLRGPSILPSPTLKKKPHSEVMDLTCFRKPTKKKPSLRLDIPSIPGQSSRTARKILNTLEQRSPFKDPDDSKRPPPVDSFRTRTAPSTAQVPGFSFPATLSGPEPPTPKPIPSPFDREKPRDLNHRKNGMLPSLQDPSFASFGNGIDSSFYLGEDVYDLDKFAARVEKASSFLEARYGGPPSSTTSPIGLVSGSGFETGSSSRENTEKVFGGSLTVAGDRSTSLGLTTAAIPTMSTTAASEVFEASKSEQFSVGAQSLAPPESNPANPSNGGFSVGAKRKKLAKRMK